MIKTKGIHSIKKIEVIAQAGDYKVYGLFLTLYDTYIGLQKWHKYFRDIVQIGSRVIYNLTIYLGDQEFRIKYSLNTMDVVGYVQIVQEISKALGKRNKLLSLSLNRQARITVCWDNDKIVIRRKYKQNLTEENHEQVYAISTLSPNSMVRIFNLLYGCDNILGVLNVGARDYFFCSTNEPVYMDVKSMLVRIIGDDHMDYRSQCPITNHAAGVILYHLTCVMGVISRWDFTENEIDILIANAMPSSRAFIVRDITMFILHSWKDGNIIKRMRIKLKELRRQIDLYEKILDNMEVQYTKELT